VGGCRHLEPLCAFVVWRDWIDDYGDDPRYELAFPRNLRTSVERFARRVEVSVQSGSQALPPDDWSR